MLPQILQGRSAAIAGILAAASVAGLQSCAVGQTTREWHSYAQVRYTQPENQDGYLSLRRLKLFGQGLISGDWSYYLQFLYKANNRSPTDDRMWVQDADAILAAKSGKLRIGQFKPPFGMERFTSDWVMPLVERSQPTNRLIPDGSVGNSFARDYGAQWEIESPGGLTSALALFVGNGANNAFEGNGPLLVGRVTYDKQYHSDRRLHAEIAASWRGDRDIDFSRQLPGAPAGYADFSGYDLREDIAVAYDWPNNSLRAEYTAARYRSNNSSTESIEADGAYVQWVHDFSILWRAAIRYEFLDTSIDDSSGFAWTTIGANYRIRSDYERIQLDYIIKREDGVQVANNELVVQYQRFFW